MYDLTAATHYLHSSRVMYRDIKPANIPINYVYSEGKKVVTKAKLCDFGLSRVLDEALFPIHVDG